MGNRPIPLRTITLHDPSQSLRGRFHRHTRKRTTQSSRAHHTHQPYASPTAAMRIPSTKGRHSARPSILVSVWNDALFKKNLPPLMRSSARQFETTTEQVCIPWFIPKRGGGLRGPGVHPSSASAVLPHLPSVRGTRCSVSAIYYATNYATKPDIVFSVESLTHDTHQIIIWNNKWSSISCCTHGSHSWNTATTSNAQGTLKDRATVRTSPLQAESG